MSTRLLTTVCTSALLSFSFATSASAAGESCDNRNNNTVAKLTECVTVDRVRAHQQAWQTIAGNNGDTRFAGTAGYDESAMYVYDQLEAAGYDVTLQPFTYTAFGQIGASTLAQLSPVPTSYAENVDYNLLAQTDAGDVTGLVESVDLAISDPSTSTSGCEADDYIGFTPGNIALVQRGACSFQQKAENGANAGAVGVIIFNQGNSPDRTGLINATLSANYSGGIPVMFATFDRGVEWAETAELEIQMIADVLRDNNALTFNVLAETKSGDPDNVVMVGAHLDSVDEGPGIQDNGSGSAAILEVALQMAKVKTRNKVRFAWWSAEESGLVGSDLYTVGEPDPVARPDNPDGLSDEEIAQIALYLNFDMIGSPNYLRFIYDGSGDAFGLAGPEGSTQIEAFFEEFYAARGLEWEPTEISFRSDYAGFFDSGIPFGGLFTGAEGIKTPEQAAIYGGTAGEQYDPCYHLACDTFDNISLEVLDLNSDAVAAAVLSFAMNTEIVNGQKGKGNFKGLRAASENLGRKKKM